MLFGLFQRAKGFREDDVGIMVDWKEVDWFDGRAFGFERLRSLDWRMIALLVLLGVFGLILVDWDEGFRVKTGILREIVEVDMSDVELVNHIFFFLMDRSFDLLLLGRRRLGVGVNDVGVFGGDLHGFFASLSTKKSARHAVRRSRVGDPNVSTKVTNRRCHVGIRFRKGAVR